ncbi:RNA polymerase sigma-70 factor [Puteibacter caeruleilacunae]|nr:RNA polymerase sigma-70 factor [Puteibacter caeruleilacunae]
MDNFDIKCACKLRNGDLEAFRTLFDNYYQSLCVYACNQGVDEKTAEDVVQEVFLNIWEKRSKVKIEESVKAYLFNSVRNRLYNLFKRDKIKAGILIKLKYDSQFDYSENEYEQDEFRSILFKCIDELPPRCGEVFSLSRFEKEKQSVIAAKLGVSVNTVKAQLGKALSLVRACLDSKYVKI